MAQTHKNAKNVVKKIANQKSCMPLTNLSSMKSVVGIVQRPEADGRYCYRPPRSGRTLYFSVA